MNILLDYFFKITSIVPTSAASTAFLKQVAVVVSPNGGGTAGNVTECTSSSEVAAVTDNTEVNQLFNAGMDKIFVIQAATLDLETLMNTHGSKFFTLLVSSDFTDTNVTSDLDLGTFKGVVGVSSSDETFLEAQAATENRCAFYRKSGNDADNMMFAFGKLLSNSSNWANQQYISMPLDDEVNTLGDANDLFNKRISFAMIDLQYGKRLGFFCAGGKAIVAPYIKRNLEVDMQGRALAYISGNQPQLTIKAASLMEDELEKDIQSFIDRAWITEGTVAITIQNSSFVATGNINISEPTGFWKVEAELRQTL